MTPGVISIAESTSVGRVFQAFAAHPVHAILVTGAQTGAPLGWITVHGLLGWVELSLVRPAREAVTERALAVRGTAPASQALTLTLSQNVTHLLVRQGTSGRRKV